MIALSNIPPASDVAWHRGQRALVVQVALLLLAAFGLDLVATFRGAKIEYGIFADCVIIVAAAWLFGNLPALLASRFFHLGALFIAVTVVFGKLEARQNRVAVAQRSGRNL